MPDNIPPQLIDPVRAHADFDNTSSKIAIAGHPIHAMLVAFPVAMAFGALGADGFYWLTGDVFWARAGLWACGMAFIFGVLAGIAGTVELLAVPGIRRRAASWSHFVFAMMLLSVLGANWGLRLGGYEQAVLPWGILVSALAVGATAITGWHGGKLVFDYHIGTASRGN